MTTHTTIHETEAETQEAAKARRNAEYLAMLDESFAQIEKGEVCACIARVHFFKRVVGQ
jgi:hypothetical protein